MEINLLLAILSGIALLLFLILRLKLQAFIALLISAIVVGLLSGLEGTAIIKSITEGIGGTLGFVATVVGLGSLFGAVLEHSGGAQVIAAFFIEKIRNKERTMVHYASRVFCGHSRIF